MDQQNLFGKEMKVQNITNPEKTEFRFAKLTKLQLTETFLKLGIRTISLNLNDLKVKFQDVDQNNLDKIKLKVAKSCNS